MHIQLDCPSTGDDLNLRTYSVELGKVTKRPAKCLRPTASIAQNLVRQRFVERVSQIFVAARLQASLVEEERRSSLDAEGLAIGNVESDPFQRGGSL